MKRLNPETKTHFRCGDRHGEMFFYNYRTDVLSNGFRGERWLSPLAFEKALRRDRLAKLKKRRQAGKPQRKSKYDS